MWLFIAGAFISWVLTVFIQGVIESRHVVKLGDEAYKMIAGFGRRAFTCRHEGEVSRTINGVEVVGCRWCDGVFIKLSDAMAVKYE